MIRRFLSCKGVDFCFANFCQCPVRAPLGQVCRCPDAGVGRRVSASDPSRSAPPGNRPPKELASSRRFLTRSRRTVGYAARRSASAADIASASSGPRIGIASPRSTNEIATPTSSTRSHGPFLAWAYSEVTDESAGESYTPVYQFADSQGHEGWFALRFGRRGRNRQIRSTRLVDVVWPNQRMSFIDVLPMIIEIAAPQSDVVSIRGQIIVGASGRALGLRRRRIARRRRLHCRAVPADQRTRGTGGFPLHRPLLTYSNGNPFAQSEGQRRQLPKWRRSAAGYAGPMMEAASSDSRNLAAPTLSAGTPGRPNGERRRILPGRVPSRLKFWAVRKTPCDPLMSHPPIRCRHKSRRSSQSGTRAELVRTRRRIARGDARQVI